MEGIDKVFQIDVGREMVDERPVYHAHFISVSDRKIGARKEATLNGLMQYVSRVIRKKEKENLMFPVEQREPSPIIIPNGAREIH